MNHIKLLVCLVGGLALSEAHAFTLHVSFLHEIPSQVNFSYAISTGNCSILTASPCHFTQFELEGIDGEYFMEYIHEMNLVFKTMTPMMDIFHNPTNFVEIKIPGQNGLCHIDVLGKNNILVRIHENGTCIT